MESGQILHHLSRQKWSPPVALQLIRSVNLQSNYLHTTYRHTYVQAYTLHPTLSPACWLIIPTLFHHKYRRYLMPFLQQLYHLVKINKAKNRNKTCRVTHNNCIIVLQPIQLILSQLFSRISCTLDIYSQQPTHITSNNLPKTNAQTNLLL